MSRAPLPFRHRSTSRASSIAPSPGRPAANEALAIGLNSTLNLRKHGRAGQCNAVERTKSALFLGESAPKDSDRIDPRIMKDHLHATSCHLCYAEDGRHACNSSTSMNAAASCLALHGMLQDRYGGEGHYHGSLVCDHCSTPDCSLPCSVLERCCELCCDGCHGCGGPQLNCGGTVIKSKLQPATEGWVVLVAAIEPDARLNSQSVRSWSFTSIRSLQCCSTPHHRAAVTFVQNGCVLVTCTLSFR